MPEHNPGQMGGTMRLGKRKTVFTNDSSTISESGITDLLKKIKFRSFSGLQESSMVTRSLLKRGIATATKLTPSM